MKYLVTDQNLGEFFFVVIWQLVASFLDKFFLIINIHIYSYTYIFIYIYMLIFIFKINNMEINLVTLGLGGGMMLFYNKLQIQIDRGNYLCLSALVI